SGQALRTSHAVEPQTAWIHTQSWPGPALVTLNQQLQDPEQPVLVIVGQEYVLEAPEIIIHNFKVGTFSNWVATSSWPLVSTASETEIISERSLELIAPSESKTYVAFYEYARSATLSYLPFIP